MPLPTLLCVTFASGIAAALASRVELRVSPRPPLLTRAFAAQLLFTALVTVPAGVYFYVFHGDWFLLYTVDVARIPSAAALVGFLALGGVTGLGFVVGASAVRSQREIVGGAVAGAAVLAGVGAAFVAKERLGLVGTFAQFQGAFGLRSFTEDIILHGTFLAWTVFLAGQVFTLLRLGFGARRGT
ncbi:MAG: hypothetical protein KF901_17165 [Myxococcales bacterium]|nr:hypothetical protein [Myxococcales bacterium]